ncbi:uncharacterized protein ARMOST_20869 [Armillaria ostoyae]|uniref:F-box domain-containing protein n=1 Tax=Armillaria ostoyae TaxID=47428 RepID=A0A284S8L9_ARMOS|nr:uncharacterized protein ARMOST_20869 [Armillaria ostoyae]
MNSTLYDLPDDVLIYTIAFLSIPDILRLRQGIWSVLTIWDIARKHKCSGWSPKGAMFTGVKLNVDKESEAGVVVSLSQIIVLLRLVDNGSLHEIRSIKADLHPVNITGDVMAVATSPRRSSTIVRPTNVPTSTTLATTCTIITSKLSSHQPLSSSSAPAPSFFTPPPSPTSRHTPLDRSMEPNGNPWASELNPLELYSLSSFPPNLVSKISSQRGVLRCTDIILDKRATAVWIRPHDRVIYPYSEYSLYSGQYNLGTAPFSEKDLGKDSELWT